MKKILDGQFVSELRHNAKDTESIWGTIYQWTKEQHKRQFVIVNGEAYI